MKMIRFLFEGMTFEGEIVQEFQKKYLVSYDMPLDDNDEGKKERYFHNVMKDERYYELFTKW